MELLLQTLMGLGLSAACGFKVFVPLLLISIAALTGDLELTAQFSWLGTNTAVVTFALATVLETIAYFIPWLDNGLDLLATPVVIVAAVITTASVVTGLSPVFQWVLALIAGGGLAGAFQVATVGVRGLSTVSTGGLGNPIVALFELVVSLVLSVVALLYPILVLIIVLTLFYLFCKRLLAKN